MSGLQGESTLSDDEKRTEARKHLLYLIDLVGLMMSGERRFVEGLSENFEKFGNHTNVSNKQLFWLRDLVVKY